MLLSLPKRDLYIYIPKRNMEAQLHIAEIVDEKYICAFLWVERVFLPGKRSSKSVM